MGSRWTELFPDEVGRFRDTGLKVCEFTKLAMDRRARSPRLLASMFHVAYIYAHRVKELSHLLIEVNPRHVRYYETMLGFDVIAAARHNPRVNAPAVLLSLDLCHAERQIRLFGGKPEMCRSRALRVPALLLVKDEEGILGRLRRRDEDIAHVFDMTPLVELHRTPVQPCIKLMRVAAGPWYCAAQVQQALSRPSAQFSSQTIKHGGNFGLTRELLPKFGQCVQFGSCPNVVSRLDVYLGEVQSQAGVGGLKCHRPVLQFDGLANSFRSASSVASVSMKAD